MILIQKHANRLPLHQAPPVQPPLTPVQLRIPIRDHQQRLRVFPRQQVFQRRRHVHHEAEELGDIVAVARHMQQAREAHGRRVIRVRALVNSVWAEIEEVAEVPRHGDALFAREVSRLEHRPEQLAVAVRDVSERAPGS